jgi:hypothetical protein
LSDKSSDQDPAFGEELVRHRPVPSAAFRGGLWRYLAARHPGHGPRPERLRVLVAAYVLVGLLLMLAALLMASGTS